MSTLLLRVAAPLQSWGASSRFKKLTTEREPTKSGIVGLLAAALGRGRDDDIRDLAALRFGVRVDQPGTLMRDYHTVRHPDNDKLAFISERYYLCDAVFVVGLESDDEDLLEELATALQNPRFPLYLGRRSCPPSGQIFLGISQLSLEDALKNEEWHAQRWYKEKLYRQAQRDARGDEIDLEIVMDAPFETAGAYTKRDMPFSLNQKHRKYGFRSLRGNINGVTIKNPYWIKPSDAAQKALLAKRETEHDPYLALEVSDVSFES